MASPPFIRGPGQSFSSIFGIKIEPSESMAKIKLPGFGYPLNYIPKDEDPEFIGRPFPSALSEEDIYSARAAIPMTTLRELTMMQLMNVATDKQDWNIKLQNPEIAKKWKEEALSSGLDITPKMVDWCLDELRYNVSLIPPGAPTPPIFVYTGDVFKSDNAVSAELKKALQENVKIFENKIPEKSKDWHPGSDQKVHDLVHPSLWPLVYGRTRVLADGETTTLEDCIQRCGQGEVTSIPTESEQTINGEDFEGNPRFRAMHYPFSAKFQWLPCEVDISGDQAKITSYINNLHPQKEKPLYEIISQLITASIPLWQLSLAPLVHENGFSRSMRIIYTKCEYDPDPEAGPKTDSPRKESDENEDSENEDDDNEDDDNEDDEDDDDDEGKGKDKVEKESESESDSDWDSDSDSDSDSDRGIVRRPEPESFKPLASPPKLDLREVYGKRGLQVIVKLANIELTPDKPEYDGGSWHVEGHMNEHIVASALYYYSSENITSSSLSFRQQCDSSDLDVVEYEQDHHDWLEDVFGCEQEGPCVQAIGSVDTCEGRLLCFPNVIQHRVGPFKLVDPTKPGHRKIVALFLVDPNIRVISTAHVPCQRMDWWIEETMLGKESTDVDAQNRVSFPTLGQVKGVNDLPLELQDIILKQVDFPISLEDAEALRLELMKERQTFSAGHADFLESETFSLCEH